MGSAPPGAPCGRVADPAPASDGVAVLARVDDGVCRYMTTVASFVLGNNIYALFFVRCDSVRSTPGGCFPQRSLSATDRLRTYIRAILRNLFRRPCALLYERAGLRSVAPRVIPKSCPRRHLRRLAPCGATGTFWKPCAPGLPCGFAVLTPARIVLFDFSGPCLSRHSFSGGGTRGRGDTPAPARLHLLRRSRASASNATLLQEHALSRQENSAL